MYTTLYVTTHVCLRLVQCSLRGVHGGPTKNTLYKHFASYEASRGKTGYLALSEISTGNKGTVRDAEETVDDLNTTTTARGK